MYREIKNTNGRYTINEEGIILDSNPKYLQYPDYDWSVKLTDPREIHPDDKDLVYLQLKGVTKNRNIFLIMRETFPELYTLSDERLEEYKARINDPSQKTVTFQISDINKLLFPNEIYIIYCKYNNDRKHWKKPFKINLHNGKYYTLNKDWQYFGVGTRYLIHFKDLLPYNGKPFGEYQNKEFYRNSIDKKKKLTELWEDDDE